MVELLKLGVRKKWALYTTLKILKEKKIKKEDADEIKKFLTFRLILTPENCIEELVKTGWVNLVISTIKFLRSNETNCLPIKGNHTTWKQLENQAWVHDVLIFLDQKIRSGSKNTSEYQAIWEAILN